MSAPLPTIKSDSFEGPLALLLELVRHKKLDITTISIGEITHDFLLYVAEVPLEAGQRVEFLSLAATLLLCKLRQIMPLSDEEEEEVNQLTDRLVIYQQYREAAARLRDRWQKEILFSGVEHVPIIRQPLSISSGDIHYTVQRLVKKAAATPMKRRHLRPVRMSLQECYATITDRLRRLSALSFEELLPQADSYTRAITLLTMMELHRQGSVKLTQSAPFAPLTIQSL